MAKPKSPPKKLLMKARSAPTHIPVRSALLSEDQVLARLRSEIGAESLTVVAARYQIKVQQLSDIMYGRANLSRRVTERLKLRLVKLYEKLHDGEGS